MPKKIAERQTKNYVELGTGTGFRLPLWKKPGNYLVDANGEEVAGFHLGPSFLAKVINFYFEHHPELRRRTRYIRRN